MLVRYRHCDRENGPRDGIPILFSPKFVCLLHSTISFFLFVSIPNPHQSVDGWGETNQDFSFHKNIFEPDKFNEYKSCGELCWLL